MTLSVDDQVIDFYYALFERIFSAAFRPRIAERLRRDAVIGQINEAAGAASQSLTRFFLNEQLSEPQVADILSGFAALADLLALGDIANPNVTPESIVETLLPKMPCPAAAEEAGCGAVYRVALHSLVQTLMLVGPIMSGWQQFNFSSTFELPRRVINRLNEIGVQMAVLGRAGQSAADERYELNYREYFLQRFYRVEAGTVRMTTNLNVDLRELFVMPRVRERARAAENGESGAHDLAALMDLAAARRFFGVRAETRDGKKAEDGKSGEDGVPVLEQIRGKARNVIVGAPGGGKSTFLEWLQLRLASVEEVYELNGEQAIPLLLRMRQLDAKRLPRGAALVERATNSRDRATLMPAGWIERQMKQGRVLFMLDGLDETEPKLRDRYVLPWLAELCEQYPDCHFLVSSRPVGYPPGALDKLGFAECDLLDFGEPEVAEYTRHWCTAVRLAQNEPEEEARREGAVDGGKIVEGFIGHQYIPTLARNPLMLSAICLVNFFEGGQLPKDRAVLYKLCVEGLLHHWDQRRGINSEFGLEEKLRACREVALAMQHDDRAEYEAAKVRKIFSKVLGNAVRGKKLLEHIRYRTGLLLERRAGVFAFAHLTFQEYLAALAVHEGNSLGIDAEQLAGEHEDGRWNEVIALYCGIAPVPAARRMLERLIAQQDTSQLSTVLAEAFLSSNTVITKDGKLRRKVLERIAVAPVISGDNFNLQRFPPDEVKVIANACVGTIQSKLAISEAYFWLFGNKNYVEFDSLAQRLYRWRRLNAYQAAELSFLVHLWASESLLTKMADELSFYKHKGPAFPGTVYSSQAEIAMLGLTGRNRKDRSLTINIDTVLLQILRALLETEITSLQNNSLHLQRFFSERSKMRLPADFSTWPELAVLTRELAERLNEKLGREKASDAVDVLTSWADKLEAAVAAKVKRGVKGKSSKKAAKKTAKGRR